LAAAIAMAEYLTAPSAGQHRRTARRARNDAPNAKTVMHEAHAFDGADISSAATRRARHRGRCTGSDRALNIVGANTRSAARDAPDDAVDGAQRGRGGRPVQHIDASRISIRPEAPSRA